MKTLTFFGLCAFLCVVCIRVRADDTPGPAAGQALGQTASATNGPQTVSATTLPMKAPVLEATPTAVIPTAEALTAPASAAAGTFVPPDEPGATNDITTASGAVYRHAKIERVEPDGITVSYEPEGGGLAITKIYFDELSNDWRQKYGYDPQKMKAYKQEEKLAAAWWREQMISNYDAAVARRQAQEKAEAEAEAQAKAELEKQAAEAAAAISATNQAGSDQLATNQIATDQIETNQPETNVIQPPQQ